jgi:hypothetical protein
LRLPLPTASEAPQNPFLGDYVGSDGKPRGVKLGRKPKLTLHEIKQALTRRDKGDVSCAAIGQQRQG